jgi:hypothetical protein
VETKPAEEIVVRRATKPVMLGEESKNGFCGTINLTV